MESIKAKTSAELRELLRGESGAARANLSALFDEGTFVELGAYVRRSSAPSETGEGFEGVVTGYGAVDGRLAFAFAQDFDREKGALGEAHARKICSLYDAAVKNGAPIIGIFNSAGAYLLEGVAALAGYGKIMKKSAEAKGIVPQIAVITGICGASAAVIASMFDFVIAGGDNGKIFVNSPFIVKEKLKNPRAGTVSAAAEAGTVDIVAKNAVEAVKSAKALLLKLPQNSSNGIVYNVSSDDANRLTTEVSAIVNTGGYDMKKVIALIADEGVFIETAADFAPEMLTGFISLNGITAGICASQPSVNGGALSASASLKAAKIVGFCGSFNIPLVTIVDSEGLDLASENAAPSYPTTLAGLATAYASYDNAKVTVVAGKAYGAAYTVFGSKSLGTDVVFALDSAKISPMPPEAAVEFTSGEKINASTDPAKEREALAAEWHEKYSSPLAAARNGDMDDIIDGAELRQRVAAAVEMQAAKFGG